MKMRIKRSINMILSLLIVMGMMPGMSRTVLATPTGTVTYKAATVDETHAVTYSDAQCDGYIVVDNNTTAFVNGGWYVVSGDVYIYNRITVTGTVNLILCNGKTMSAQQGITVESGNTLNIYAQSLDDSVAGNLSAQGSNGCAGIGGGNGGNGGTVTINGGNVTVTLLSGDSRIGFLNRTVIAVSKVGCDKSQRLRASAAVIMVQVAMSLSTEAGWMFTEVTPALAKVRVLSAAMAP